MLRRAIAIVPWVLLAAGTAHAQPASALGKSMTDPSLTPGTVTVRVVRLPNVQPVTKVTVTLVVDGKAQTATTDDSGRATFTGIAAGAQVRANAIVDGERVVSDPFAAPAVGGTRVILGPKPKPPAPREFSGTVRPTDEVAAGTYTVRVLYDDPADPARDLPVTLVGYAFDDSVRVLIQRTDRTGTATFTKLDATGATTYFAMALVPRGRAVDRIIAKAVTLESQRGATVTLSSLKRSSTAAAIDELPVPQRSKPAVSGKLRVALEGQPDPTSTVTLVDAATGKPIATASVVAPETDAVFDVAKRTGIVYAETSARGEKQRTQPFALSGGATSISLATLPRTLATLQIVAHAEGSALSVAIGYEILNHSWSPLRVDKELPLPAGARDLELADSSADDAAITATGFRLTRPVPPGGKRIIVSFTVPAVKNRAYWELPLPYGAYDGRIQVTRDTGMTIDVPAGHAAHRPDAFVFDNVTLPPGRSLAMTVGMPVLTAAETAFRAACGAMQPDRGSQLVGKPMPKLAGVQLDGTTLDLATLKGKLVLVNFDGSWNGLAKIELPTFAGAQAAIRDLAIVVIASDDNVEDVRRMVGAKPPYRVIFDRAVDPDKIIGPLTASLGIVALPESFVVDRSGVVRAYFVNKRDWGSDEALRCLKAIK